MGFWDAYPGMARGLEEVKDLILRQDIADDPEVRASVRTLVLSNGKMLRPGFVLLASRFGEPDPAKTARVAAAVEMLHMATLVHDDIVDDAPMRRGVPTLGARHGPRIAVLAGDSLFAACFSMVAEDAGLEEARSLARVVAHVCRSEVSQSAGRFTPAGGTRPYLRRIAGKTALLFSLSLYAGARQGGCEEALGARLRRAGYCIGMGFQIIDDVLDIEGTGMQTGKPVGQDLSQGIITLPVILSLRNDADGKLGAALSRGPYGRRAVRRILRLVRERGGVQRARAAAGSYTERAVREIALLPPGEPRNILSDAASRLLSRFS
jgi:heptaprenyl diphosphate synthase